MTPSCNNCRNVELEIVEMKNFISRWFDVFSRRFDDQDRKLTILVDAVSAVNNDYNNQCNVSVEKRKNSSIIDDEAQDFCFGDDEEEEADQKNILPFYEQSETTENNQLDHSPSASCVALMVHGNSSLYDNGIGDQSQADDDQRAQADILSTATGLMQSALDDFDPALGLNNSAEEDCTDLSHSVQNIFDFYSPSLIEPDELVPISLVRDNNSSFTNIFQSSSSHHSSTANDNFQVDSKPSTSTGLSMTSHFKHARKRIASVRPSPPKFPSSVPKFPSSSMKYPSIYSNNHSLKRKFSTRPTDQLSNTTQTSGETRLSNILRINKTNFRPSLPNADQPRASSTSSSLGMLHKTKSPFKGDLGSVKSKFSETCPICSKRFSSVYGMNRHKKVKHNERGVIKFKCKFCNKTYAWNSDLLKHINLAHKSESCPIINETF